MSAVGVMFDSLKNIFEFDMSEFSSAAGLNWLKKLISSYKFHEIGKHSEIDKCQKYKWRMEIQFVWSWIYHKSSETNGSLLMLPRWPENKL